MDESRLSGLEAWQRRRGIRPGDVIAIGVIFLIAAGATLAYILAPQTWSATKIVTLITADMALLGLSIWHFFRKWLARPDIVTKHGAAFWTSGIDLPEVSLQVLMEQTLDRFIDVMKREQTEATPAEIRKMLSKTAVHWNRGRVSLITNGYELNGKEGIQHGFKIYVHWKGNIADSALFHELLHEVNAIIRLPRIKGAEARKQFIKNNLRHYEPTWWMLEGMLVDDF